MECPYENCVVVVHSILNMCVFNEVLCVSAEHIITNKHNRQTNDFVCVRTTLDVATTINRSNQSRKSARGRRNNASLLFVVQTQRIHHKVPRERDQVYVSMCAV